MAEQTDNKVPQIRFKGFEGEWEEKWLGAICTIGDADHWMPKTASQGIPYVMTGDFCGVNEINFGNAKLISEADYEKLSIKIKPELGDILFARYASVGAVRLVRVARKFIVSYSCAILKNNNSFSSHYLFYLLQTDRSQNQIKQSVNTGSQGNIGIDSLKQLPAIFPEKSEQNKIGEYFGELNSLTGLHQRKHDKLVALKKSMLQKMFPQPSATTPEVRFKGFSGDWVNHEFKQIASRSTQATSEEYLPRVEYEDIISGTGCLNKDVFKKSSKKVGARFEKSDVLFGKLRPYLKNWWLAEFDGIAVGDFWILKPAAATSNLIYFLIQTEDFERIANQSAGSKMPRSDWKLVSNSVFRIPTHIEEQQKIGTYFRTLDKLISQHATQLQKLQQLKSACLEKMFV